MIALWLVFLVLTLVGLGFIIWPLIKSDVGTEKNAQYLSEESRSRAQLNTAIYKERLSELKEEHKQGNIDNSQFQELEAELQQTFLGDVPEAQSGLVDSVSSKTFSIGRFAAGLTFVFALAVVAFYMLVSHNEKNMQWITLQEKMTPVLNEALYGIAMPEKEGQKLEYTYADYIRTLQAHLQSNQKNVEGWMQLGKAYLDVELPQYGLEAYQRAFDLAPQKPQVLLGLAEAQVYQARGKLTKESRGLIEAVLRQEPKNGNALMLMGMASFATGEYQSAISAWEKLLQLRQGQVSNERARQGEMALRKSIALAKERLGVAPSGSSDGRMLSAISVMVDIEPSLKSQLSSSDILFVYAKAVEGPPMPVAVVKQAVSGFPVEVQLDDSSAMTARMRLSNFDQVNVVARVSKNGQPIAQPGDLQTSAYTVKASNGNELVTLTIDSVL